MGTSHDHALAAGNESSSASSSRAPTPSGARRPRRSTSSTSRTTPARGGVLRQDARAAARHERVSARCPARPDRSGDRATSRRARFWPSRDRELSLERRGAGDALRDGRRVSSTPRASATPSARRRDGAPRPAGHHRTRGAARGCRHAERVHQPRDRESAMYAELHLRFAIEQAAVEGVSTVILDDLKTALDGVDQVAGSSSDLRSLSMEPPPAAEVGDVEPCPPTVVDLVGPSSTSQRRCTAASRGARGARKPAEAGRRCS